MQFANEFTTIYLSNQEEILSLAIKRCPTNNTTVMLLYKNLTEAGDNKYTAFWLVNTFTRQYFEDCTRLYGCVKIDQSGLVNSKLNIKITQELNNI